VGAVNQAQSVANAAGDLASAAATVGVEGAATGVDAAAAGVDAAARGVDAAAAGVNAAAAGVNAAASGVNAAASAAGQVEAEIEEAVANPADVLIGTWRPVRVEVGGQMANASGKLIFYDDASGFANLTIAAQGMELPQIGNFEWNRTGGDKVVVETLTESLNWRVVESEADRQVLSGVFEGGIEARMILERLR
ncbi:MAG: hypothetical protein AAF772_18825, partial [Acidobacteriota bacterium]